MRGVAVSRSKMVPLYGRKDEPPTLLIAGRLMCKSLSAMKVLGQPDASEVRPETAWAGLSHLVEDALR